MFIPKTASDTSQQIKNLFVKYINLFHPEIVDKDRLRPLEVLVSVNGREIDIQGFLYYCLTQPTLVYEIQGLKALETSWVNVRDASPEPDELVYIYRQNKVIPAKFPKEPSPCFLVLEGEPTTVLYQYMSKVEETYWCKRHKDQLVPPQPPNIT